MFIPNLGKLSLNTDAIRSDSEKVASCVSDAKQKLATSGEEKTYKIVVGNNLSELVLNSKSLKVES